MALLHLDRTFATFAAALLVIVLLGGCVGSPRGPHIEVVEARVVEVEEDTLALSVGLMMTNPNDVPVQLKEYRYEAQVPGSRDRYDGRWAALATLGPGQTRLLHIPAILPVPDALQSTSSDTGDGRSDGDNQPRIVEVTGRIGYVPPGLIMRVLADNGFYRPAARFSGSVALEPAGEQQAGEVESVASEATARR